MSQEPPEYPKSPEVEPELPPSSGEGRLAQLKKLPELFRRSAIFGREAFGRARLWSAEKIRDIRTIRPDEEGLTPWQRFKKRSEGASGSFKEWLKRLPETLKDVDPQVVTDWITQKFQEQKASSYGKALIVILCSYFLADLAALFLGEQIKPPVTNLLGSSRRNQRPPKTLDDYQIIFTRNLFNSRGIIPGEESQNGPNLDLPPVRTSLPFNLVGTLVLSDELKSIASIEDKSASQVYPVRVEDEIPSKAKILQIEANRVVFINTQSGRKEFIDMPEETLRGPELTLRTPPKQAGIDRVTPTQFNVSKTEVDKALADPVTLTQARCLPALENGQSVGFRCFQIVPGSIYEKIGIQNNDIITTLNGQSMTDPSTAVETLLGLKGANHIELAVKRNGKPMVFNYDIR